MKKIMLITLIAIANVVNAQKSKLIQKINAGGFVSTVASTTFTKGEKPFALGYNYSAIVTVITKKTFHNAFYGFGNNTFNTMNGYLLKNNVDVYLIYSKKLDEKGSYAGGGIEQMEKLSEKVKLLQFAELGRSSNGKLILSFGMVLNYSWRINK